MTDKDEKDIDQFLNNITNASLYHTTKYKALLVGVLSSANSKYIVARDSSGNVCGLLPCFIKKSMDQGSIMNSLPYYGSHGDLITSPELNPEQLLCCRQQIMKLFLQICHEENIRTATIITTGLSNTNDFLESYFELNNIEFITVRRVGQITTLPDTSDEFDDGEAIMNMCHQKSRNMIRKGYKSNYEIEIDNSPASFQTLLQLHTESMLLIGGIPKQNCFFDFILNNYKPNIDYNIYTAKSDGEIVASLLLLYFKNTVEYFVPATRSDHKKNQPMSAVIHTALTEAMRNNYKKWSWGGTPVGHKNLHRFKSRFGADDHFYCSYTLVFDNSIKNETSETLLKSFPDFYSYPFHELNGKKKNDI